MSVPIQAGVAFSAGQPTRVFQIDDASDMEPSPDGKRFLVIRTVAPQRLGRIVMVLGGALEIGRAP